MIISEKHSSLLYQSFEGEEENEMFYGFNFRFSGSHQSFTFGMIDFSA